MSRKLNFQTVPLHELPGSPATHAEIEYPRFVVLVVDDEAVIADTLVAILSQNGIVAIPAYGGRTALEIARYIAPDLLLTDVMMPEMSGIELAIEVQESIPDCKVLLFSGTSAAADLLASEGGQHNFSIISKPIHPADLLVRVSGALHSRTAE